MAWELVAQGNANNLADAGSYEDQIDEGQRGRLDMTFSVNVPAGDIDALRDSLAWAGVEDLEVVSGGNTVSIYYRKGFAWVPLIISLVLVALIAVMVYLTIWKLSKELSGPAFNIVMIGGAILAAGIAYFLFRRQY